MVSQVDTSSNLYLLVILCVQGLRLGQLQKIEISFTQSTHNYDDIYLKDM